MTEEKFSVAKRGRFLFFLYGNEVHKKITLDDLPSNAEYYLMNGKGLKKEYIFGNRRDMITNLFNSDKEFYELNVCLTRKK